MSLVRFDAIRLGPTDCDSSGLHDVGTIPLSKITEGLSDNESALVDVIYFAFAASSASVYSYYGTLTAAIRYQVSGPTYTMGALSSNLINSGDAVYRPVESITIDITGTDLRLRAQGDVGSGFTARVFAWANVLRTW